MITAARIGLRDYFAQDARRALQTALGLLWLVDGALQFQPFMYSSGFPRLLVAAQAGQPHWLSAGIAWGARFAGADLPLWNTLFALTQVALGLGILFRPTVRIALAGSFAWALVVWWFGEGFGSLLAGTASPLTGAPGAVVLYALVGLAVWPGNRRGGLAGVRGLRLVWAALWSLAAWLWLLPANSGADATREAIAASSSGIGLLGTVQRQAGSLAGGHGLSIALVLAAVSLAIGLAVAVDWQARSFLRLAIWLNLGYWVVGQGLGGLATGTATDPNAAPLFVLLAVALLTLQPARAAGQARRPPELSTSSPDREALRQTVGRSALP